MSKQTGQTKRLHDDKTFQSLAILTVPDPPVIAGAFFRPKSILLK